MSVLGSQFVKATNTVSYAQNNASIASSNSPKHRPVSSDSSMASVQTASCSSQAFFLGNFFERIGSSLKEILNNLFFPEIDKQIAKKEVEKEVNKWKNICTLSGEGLKKACGTSHLTFPCKVLVTIEIVPRDGKIFLLRYNKTFYTQDALIQYGLQFLNKAKEDVANYIDEHSIFNIGMNLTLVGQKRTNTFDVISSGISEQSRRGIQSSMNINVINNPKKNMNSDDLRKMFSDINSDQLNCDYHSYDEVVGKSGLLSIFTCNVTDSE